MWRQLSFAIIRAVLLQDLFCCNLCWFVVKCVWSRFTHFCLEKNWTKNCVCATDCGEKRTNIRYDEKYLHLHTSDSENFHWTADKQNPKMKYSLTSIYSTMKVHIIEGCLKYILVMTSENTDHVLLRMLLLAHHNNMTSHHTVFLLDLKKF